jgi:hypothetical protein
MMDGDLKGMKSHDYHVMMQEILPLCMQHLMTKDCRIAIICLCRIFKRICAKVVDPTRMGELKNDVAITLVLLEDEFPPSFFDVMTHLLVHLVEKLELCGSMCTWVNVPCSMISKNFERYVRNRAKFPEGKYGRRVCFRGDAKVLH